MENLIAEYLEAVEKCLTLFEAKFGRRDLIRAWREGDLSPSGVLTDGVNYHLHGVGCVVEYQDFDVDFDFATRDKVGFDAWRLWMFAKQFPERYPDYQERSAIQAGIDSIVADGKAALGLSGFYGEVNDRLFLLTSKQ